MTNEKLNLPRKELVDLKKYGFSANEIAKMYGAGRTTICNLLREEGFDLSTKINLDKAKVIKGYCEEEKSLEALSKENNCSAEKIRKFLVKNNIERRRRKSLPEDKIIGMGLDNKSTYEIAKPYGVSHQTIGRVFKKHGIEPRNVDNYYFNIGQMILSGYVDMELKFKEKTA
jgi:DNA invertase Pin-like site-specific DNA recombinase